jgi:hypothetical protein
MEDKHQLNPEAASRGAQQSPVVLDATPFSTKDLPMMRWHSRPLCDWTVMTTAFRFVAADERLIQDSGSVPVDQCKASQSIAADLRDPSTSVVRVRRVKFVVFPSHRSSRVYSREHSVHTIQSFRLRSVLRPSNGCPLPRYCYCAG